MQAKTYEEVVTPLRVARQRWLYPTPTSADNGFPLFDRNADGFIDIGDMSAVAKITTGENVPDGDLRAYIARGDLNGDGMLDEPEFYGMLQRERAEGKGKGRGHGKATETDSQGSGGSVRA